MDWDGYSPYVPPVGGPLEDLDREVAQAQFDHLMEHKAERLVELARLVGANGVKLGVTDESLDELDDWFRLNVEASPEDPTRLRNLWYAVVTDIAMHLGDVMIHRAPTLRWEFFRWGGESGHRNVSYHHPVIMGFRKASDEHYNRDLMRNVAAYGLRAAAGRVDEPGYFKKIVNYDVSMA
jgi:hypothetical protein